MAATFNQRVTSSSPSLIGSCDFIRRSPNFESSRHILCFTQINGGSLYPAFSSTLSITSSKHKNCLQVVACVSPSQSQKSTANFTSSTKLYVSGLSFRTSEESLRNAFQSFGQLIEVNLVMDKIAKRPRGFAFLRYATKEESEKAIEGMHGKNDHGYNGNNKIHFSGQLGASNADQLLKDHDRRIQEAARRARVDKTKHTKLEPEASVNPIYRFSRKGR